jgi:FtsZ-interacting cell division protein ZipA
MATKWFYETDDETRGPISTDELKKRIESGKLRPHHMVKSDTKTNGRWVEMKRFALMFTWFEEAQEKRHKQRAARHKKEQVVASSPKSPRIVDRPVDVQRRGGPLPEKRNRDYSPPMEMWEPEEHPKPTVHSFPPQPALTEVAQPQQPQQKQPQQAVQVIVNQQRQEPSYGLPIVLNLLLWPGLGQLAQGRTLAGMFWMFSWVVSWILVLAAIGLLLVPLVYFGALIDVAMYKGSR